MTTPSLTSLPSASAPGPIKRKRVLLVDTRPEKRSLRAEIMRRLGMDVDCAADISEARSWWRADLYDLVLINVGHELGRRDKFCEDMRSALPPQQLAFLVGKPDYLADTPNAEGAFLGQEESDPSLATETSPTRPDDVPGSQPQRWGILEASRQISAVRSASHARSKALQARPAPPRDSEVRLSRRATEAPTLDELLRKEMQ